MWQFFLKSLYELIWPCAYKNEFKKLCFQMSYLDKIVNFPRILKQYKGEVPDSRIFVSLYPRYRDFEGQRKVLQRFFRGLEKNSSNFNQGAMFESKIMLNLKFLITKCSFFSKYK